MVTLLWYSFLFILLLSNGIIINKHSCSNGSSSISIISSKRKGKDGLLSSSQHLINVYWEMKTQQRKVSLNNYHCLYLFLCLVVFMVLYIMYAYKYYATFINDFYAWSHERKTETESERKTKRHWERERERERKKETFYARCVCVLRLLAFVITNMEQEKHRNRLFQNYCINDRKNVTRMRTLIWLDIKE